MALESGESRATIQRYIRLTYLIDSILEQVDVGTMPMNVGVSLSFLELRMQQCVWDFLQEKNRQSLTLAQAEQVKESAAAGTLCDDVMADICGIASITENAVEYTEENRLPSSPRAVYFSPKIAVDLSPQMLKTIKKDDELQQRIGEAVSEILKNYLEEHANEQEE